MSTSITNYGFGHPKLWEDVLLEKLEKHSMVIVFVWDYLNSLRNIIYSYQDVTIAKRHREWSHEVNAPNKKKDQLSKWGSKASCSCVLTSQASGIDHNSCIWCRHLWKVMANRNPIATPAWLSSEKQSGLHMHFHGNDWGSPVALLQECTSFLFDRHSTWIEMALPNSKHEFLQRSASYLVFSTHLEFLLWLGNS